MANKVWDAKQNRWVAADPSVLNSSKTNTSTAKTTTSNKTYYPDITGEPTTKNVSSTGQGDTSYIQDAGYYREGNNWDYNADVTQDKNRAAQIKGNLEKDAVANPKLFENRADFEKYYHYNERHGSQKQLLDEAWDNYNKVGLTSDENYRADNASKIADKKNQEIIQNAVNKYNKLMPAINKIVEKFNERLGPVFDQLRQYQTRYLTNLAELRKLENDYYAGRKREYDQLAAGQSASVGTTLSGQGLSQSAIASTVAGVDKQWQGKQDELMSQHINNLKNLQDSETSFMNTYAGIAQNLTSAEQTALTTWFNSFRDLENGLESAYNKGIEEKYEPYQTLAKSYVTGQTESAQSGGKREDVDAIYKGYDADKRAQMINGYLKTYFGEDVDISKFTPYIKQAATYNDLPSAMEFLANKTKTPAKVTSNPNPNPNPNPDETPTTVDPTKYNSYEEYKKAGGKYTETMWNYYKNKK